jgi:hypothetical protein
MSYQSQSTAPHYEALASIGESPSRQSMGMTTRVDLGELLRCFMSLALCRHLIDWKSSTARASLPIQILTYN